MGMIVNSLGYFMPSIYLPLFARSIGLSQEIGTLLVALVNGAAVFSTISIGMLIDRFHVTDIILPISLCAALSVFIFWGFATTLPWLIAFSTLYGFFAGGFVSTIAGVIKVVKQQDETADVGTLLGLLSAGRGLGAVLSGPFSDVLLGGKGVLATSHMGYGSAYEGLIIFTGATAATGSIGFLGKRLGWM